VRGLASKALTSRFIPLAQGVLSGPAVAFRHLLGLPAFGSLRRAVAALGAALALGGSSVAADEPPPPRAMTLPEALAYAREHQPAVKAALARVKSAEADASVTRAQWVPYLAATAQLLGGTANNTTASYLSVSGVDVPRVGGTSVTSAGSLQPYASTFAAISVTQQVFDFGRIAAQAAVNDSAIDFRRLSAGAEALAIDLGVEESYFAVHAARGVLKASEDAYQRSLVHGEVARAKVAAGLREPIDLTRAEADVARFDVGRVRARGGLVAAQAAFAAAVGIPEGLLDAAGEPPPPAGLPSLRVAIERAAERDPTIQAAQALVRVQEAETRSIAAQLRPNLLLSASFSGREGGAPPSSGGSPANYAGWVPDVPNWDVGLVLRIPIFDWVTWKRVDASAQREAVGRAELERVRQAQTAAVQQAYVAVDAAQRALGALERAVEAARANYAQADARFKGGLATVVELADAESLRTETEIHLALGRFELARQRAVLGRLLVEAT